MARGVGGGAPERPGFALRCAAGCGTLVKPGRSSAHLSSSALRNLVRTSSVVSAADSIRLLAGCCRRALCRHCGLSACQRRAGRSRDAARGVLAAAVRAPSPLQLRGGIAASSGCLRGRCMHGGFQLGGSAAVSGAATEREIMRHVSTCVVLVWRTSRGCGGRYSSPAGPAARTTCAPVPH